MPSVYYFLDLDLKSKKIIHLGIVNTANHTGDTDQENVHRVFLTKGQYNKLLSKVNKLKTA